MTGLGRRLATAAALCLLAGPAVAQVPRLRLPAERTDFLSRFDYHFSLVALANDEPQYDWDGHFGGDFDIVGGPRGRANARFDYETVLGGEFQPFDPVQGNYDIELLGGYQRGHVEYAGVFHHTSRHLGDRAKGFGIAWNLLGLQVAWTRVTPARSLQVRGRVLPAITNDYVDYTGVYSVDATWEQRTSDRLGWVARSAGLVRTTERVSPRGSLWGGSAEAGATIAGGLARLEIVGGVERRVDANAFEAVPVTWAYFGLRILNR